MNILSKWFFYVLIVGAIGALIGLILIFTIDNTIVAAVVLVISLIMVILGIVFWVMESKKPQPPEVEKTNSMKNLISRTPVVGDTLSETYVQVKEQAIPVVTKTLKSTVTYPSQNTKIGRFITS